MFIITSPAIISVVETNDGERYLGFVDVGSEVATVRTGYQGRPFVLAVDDIESITPASEHPDVVFV